MPFYLNGLRYRPRPAKRTFPWIIVSLLVISVAGNVLQWTTQKSMQVRLNNAIISSDSTLAARHEAERKINKLTEELEITKEIQQLR
ncbi:hypothetical protein [Siphonobacter sp. SORGH_AS_1065]|uniref:hypothetical protein n=1 Tax=Siphonobacter sp. SORGH_AS_1065 TaxID=3041795 RepID=UPI00278AE204|nr:hypothetical protein [Siphonobacter sp. SORGH_AS_1065]MDQ1088872.1 hypothetical protein [Siphonobacter sp. SORGH_AS_1065]